MFEVAASPEVHVEVRAVDVVGCFDVAHYEKREGMEESRRIWRRLREGGVDGSSLWIWGWGS
jgi:hypothetical protein